MSHPKWAEAARARDEWILLTLSEVPDWWPTRIEPRLVREDGCLVWTGAVDGRYPLVALPDSIAGRGVIVKVHRVSYLREHGSIPYGWTVDHRCENTRCCDLAHLEAVSQAENMARAGHLMSRGSPGIDWVAKSEDLVRAHLGGIA